MKKVLVALLSLLIINVSYSLDYSSMCMVSISENGCFSETRENRRDININGKKVGTRTTCDCVKNDMLVMCEPSTSDCYDMDFYPNITCIEGYRPNGLTCEACPLCTNCNSDTNWSAGNTGYEKFTTKKCDCGTCITTISYRCAAGYYGLSLNGTTGCTRCPDNNSTSNTGSTSITNCYIPKNKAIKDSGGTYEFATDCYYTN